MPAEELTLRSREGSARSRPTTERRWLWILSLVFLVFMLATLAVVVVAVTGNGSSLPKKIDVVLFDRGAGVVKAQIKAVQTYMKWCNALYVLSTTQNEVKDGVTYVKIDSTDLNTAFLAIESLDGIAEHALFLADYTLPFRTVLKQYLFYNDRPRLFNYFRDYTEEIFVTHMDFPVETLPTMVLNVATLKEVKDKTQLSATETVNRYIFRAITEERIVVRNDMNREIYIDGSMEDNATIQFDKLKSQPPVFATFFPKPNAKSLLVTKLNTCFGII